MPVTRHASRYVRFLNLINAVRQMPTLPVLDAVEERLLGAVLAEWMAGRQLPVTEAARMEAGTPERTAFRRIKSLHEKGLLSFEVCPDDNRVKYIVPTDTAGRYFDALGRCMEQARDSLWPHSKPLESGSR